MKVLFANKGDRFSILFKLLDIAFACLILSPLVIVYWFTAWKLSDLYITPDNPAISGAISFAIGISGQLVFSYFHAEFEWITKRVKWHLVRVVITKVYSLMYAVTLICYWRGTWELADQMSSNHTRQLITDVVQNSLILMLAKVFKNTISIPFVTLTDDSSNCFSTETYFKLKVNYL